jgi:ATP-dependent RNA helicase DHX57
MTPKVESYLASMLDAPNKLAIAVALDALQSLSAVTKDGHITSLGKYLSSIPTDVRIGKFLIFAGILGCVGPALTIAGCMSMRSFFVSPSAARDEAKEKHKAFSTFSAKSDLLTMVAAYDAWRNVVGSTRGQREERDFCRENFLHRETLNEIHQLRDQYLGILQDMGFASRRGDPSSDRHSDNTEIVKAALCCGLYPRVVKVVHPKTTYHKMEHGTIANASKAQELKFMLRSKETGVSRVFLHPQSINFVRSSCCIRISLTRTARALVGYMMVCDVKLRVIQLHDSDVIQLRDPTACDPTT